jgi:hypothetical protein
MLTQSRGHHRHTSSDDKYDLKKVVTTRFYSTNGSKIATCHAHGDGTWNILFTEAGKTQLAKMDLSPTTEEALDVTVFQRIDEGGKLFHYGEMINKPDVCRRPITENNDERHRLKQAEPGEVNKRTSTELFPTRIPRTEEVTADGDDNSRSRKPRNESAITTSRSDVGNPRYSQYNRDYSLTLGQQQLAGELAEGGLTGKEQRSLFQKLKSMPLEQQELILERSKLLKLQNTS